jgi:predicted phosphodiesterase
MRFIIFLVLMSFVAKAEENKGEYAWIEYIHNNLVSARATTLAAECPEIIIDGKSVRMNLRIEQDDIALKEKVRVCEYNVTNANKVSIRNQQLKLPAKKVNRFIVMGDTGCEESIYDEHHRAQKCADPKEWPFKRVADLVAQQNPDFVIHLGDYAYRNKYNNPIDGEKNQQMQWFFFKNEFFEPAKNLLSKVPMVFIRGNHEACQLTGKGWFLFFDPQKFQSCQKYTPSYKLEIDNLKFIVFDSSGSKEAQDEQYQKEFSHLRGQLNQKHWLLVHHPIITMPKLSQDKAFSKVHAPAIGEAFGSDMTNNIPLVISGHYHVSAFLTRKSDKLFQLVLGNGGTKLHKSEDKHYIYEDDIAKGKVDIEYGYTQFDRLEDQLWKVTNYNIDGVEMFNVVLSSK